MLGGWGGARLGASRDHDLRRRSLTRTSGLLWGGDVWRFAVQSGTRGGQRQSPRGLRDLIGRRNAEYHVEELLRQRPHAVMRILVRIRACLIMAPR